MHVNGNSAKSCTMLAVQAMDAEITTIEGLADGDTLHPMQEAFRNNHGLPHTSAVDLLNKNSDPSETEIREWLEGNICRCTGYHNIGKSIKERRRLICQMEL